MLHFTFLYRMKVFISLHSYQQAQSAVAIGLRKLQELDVPTTRPDDYFAEMIKTDDHMRKVYNYLYIIFV